MQISLPTIGLSAWPYHIRGHKHHTACMIKRLAAARAPTSVMGSFEGSRLAQHPRGGAPVVTPRPRVSEAYTLHLPQWGAATATAPAAASTFALTVVAPIGLLRGRIGTVSSTERIKHA